MKTVIGPAAAVHAKLRAALPEAERAAAGADRFGPSFQARVSEAVENLKRCLADWQEVSRPVEMVEQ